MKWKAGSIGYFERSALDANPRITKTRAEADDGDLEEDYAASRPFLCVSQTPLEAEWLPLTRIANGKDYRYKIDPRWLRGLPPAGAGPWETSYIMDSAITYRGPHAEFDDDVRAVYMSGDGLKTILEWLTAQGRSRPRREVQAQPVVDRAGEPSGHGEPAPSPAAATFASARAALEALRQASLAEPFRPFVVTLRDQRRFEIRARGDVLMPLAGECAVVFLRGVEAHAPVVLTMVVSIEFDPHAAPARAPGATGVPVSANR